MLIAPEVAEELFATSLIFQFLGNECNTDWPVNVKMMWVLHFTRGRDLLFFLFFKECCLRVKVRVNINPNPIFF